MTQQDKEVNLIVTAWQRRGGRWLKDECERVGIEANATEYYFMDDPTSSQRRQGERTLSKFLGRQDYASIHDICMYCDDDNE